MDWKSSKILIPNLQELDFIKKISLKILQSLFLKYTKINLSFSNDILYLLFTYLFKNNILKDDKDNKNIIKYTIYLTIFVYKTNNCYVPLI